MTPASCWQPDAPTPSSTATPQPLCLSLSLCFSPIDLQPLASALSSAQTDWLPGQCLPQPCKADEHNQSGNIISSGHFQDIFRCVCALRQAKGVMWSDGLYMHKGFEPCSDTVPCPSPSVLIESHGKIPQDSHGSKIVYGNRRRPLKQLLLYLICNVEPGLRLDVYATRWCKAETVFH